MAQLHLLVLVALVVLYHLLVLRDLVYLFFLLLLEIPANIRKVIFLNIEKTDLLIIN